MSFNLKSHSADTDYFLFSFLRSFPHLILQPKHQDTFSLAPQRPLTTINPIGHSLHPNGAPTLKPSPVPRTIQAMPWEQRSLYNQWDPQESVTSLHVASTTFPTRPPPHPIRIQHQGWRTSETPPPPHPSFGTLFGIREGHCWELVEIDYWVARLKMCCLDPHVWSMPCTEYKLKCPHICPLTKNLSPRPSLPF